MNRGIVMEAQNAIYSISIEGIKDIESEMKVEKLEHVEKLKQHYDIMTA